MLVLEEWQEYKVVCDKAGTESHGVAQCIGFRACNGNAMKGSKDVCDTLFERASY
jgi:hypothetical protein